MDLLRDITRHFSKKIAGNLSLVGELKTWPKSPSKLTYSAFPTTEAECILPVKELKKKC